MRVSSLRLRDFRGFAACDLSLDRPLTVLVGVNGAGKTSVLEALVRLLGMTNRVSVRMRRLLVDADIRRGADACEIDMVGMAKGAPLHSVIQLKRQERPNITTSRSRRDIANEGEGRASIALPAAYYPATRMVPSERYEPERRPLTAEYPGNLEMLESPDRLSLRAQLNFKDFFEWFRFREDFENEQRARGETGYEDRPLTAVRKAIEQVVPGISRLRVQRIPYRLVATKDGAELELDQLSDGERGLLAMIGDLSYRLTIMNPDLPDPLQGEALVLIDEIEQHLHPAWQRMVVGALRRAFPNCQFIITTHSPQVISEVPNEAVMLLKDFQFFRPAAPTEGRDTNAILWEVLGVEARPHEVGKEIEAISGLLDEGALEEARRRLDDLARALTERDTEVARLRGLLDVVERLDMPEQMDARAHEGA